VAGGGGSDPGHIPGGVASPSRYPGGGRFRIAVVARGRDQPRQNRVGAAADPPDLVDEIADRVDDERRMRPILAAVRRLPKAEREAIALCVWAGLSYAEAAAALGIGEGSVRSRLSRARARLARMLGKDELPQEEPQ
jgi:RNA polymerase sigma factor (sigma-70 family)